MERSAGQQLAGAFVVGGLIAVVSQVIMIVVSKLVPIHNLIVPVSLVCLGLLGMVLVLCGVYKRIAEVGGFGAGIMFCGLVDTVANIFVGASMGARGDSSAGFKAILKFAIINLGSIIVVGTLLGVVCVGTPGVRSVMAGATIPNPGLIVFFYAFLMGGLISVEGQMLITFANLPDPAVILINAALGMLLAVFGASANLEVLTGAGLCMTVADAGATAVMGGALITLAGVPMVTITLTVVMALVVIMGLICGNVSLKRIKAQCKN